MKLKTAFDSAVAEHPDGLADIVQFINRYAHRSAAPTNYRCVGAAVAAVTAFLNAAGLAGSFTVEDSTLDPDFHQIRWSGPDAPRMITEDLATCGYTTRRSPLALLAGDSTVLADTDANVVAPAAELKKPVDAFECLRHAYEVLGTPSCRLDSCVMAIAAPRIAEKVAKGANPVFSESIYSSAFRYVRDDEVLVPVPGFFEAPYERTVGAEEDCDAGDTFTGYLGYTVADLESADTSGCQTLMIMTQNALVPDVSVLEFASDRNRLYAYLRDIYEKVYGCDGKYKVLVDPRTRVTVDNQSVAFDGGQNTRYVLQFDDRGTATYSSVPVRVQAVLYVVPAELVGENNPAHDFGEPGKPRITVVKSREDVFSGPGFLDRYVGRQELASQWFFMTHLGRKNCAGNSWGHDDAEAARRAADVKTAARACELDAKKASAACCVPSSPHFRLDDTDRYSSPVPHGAPHAAYAHAVGGILRMAWCQNTGTDSDPSTAVPGAEAGGLHDPGSLVTAVYSGVSNPGSPSVSDWVAGTAEPPVFPRVDQLTTSGDWNRFIRDLPGSGVMFKVPEPSASGEWLSYHVITETNIPYDEFTGCFDTGRSGGTSLGSVLGMLNAAGVANLMFRSTDPVFGLECWEDGTRRCQHDYAVGKRLAVESGNRLTVANLLNCSVAANYEAWIPGTDVVTAFRRDDFNRLYVVTTFRGPKAYFGQLVHRFCEGMNVTPAAHAVRAASSRPVPDGYVVVPEGHNTDLGCVRLYATQMLLSPVGDRYNRDGCDLRNTPETCARFWTYAYRGNFVNHSYVDNRDSSVPARRWFDWVSGNGGKVTVKGLLG